MTGMMLTGNGAPYSGREEFITLAVVLSVGVALLVFLMKYWFDQVNRGLREHAAQMVELKDSLQAEVHKNNEKINERIDKLEERTNQEIGELRQDMNDLKGEFSMIYVQRDEFYRYMNGMEANVKDTNSKVDRILMMMTEGRGKGQ